MDFYNSPAYGKLCGRIHGIDLKQMSMVTLSELEFFVKEIQFAARLKILDLGCGVGILLTIFPNDTVRMLQELTYRRVELISQKKISRT